MRPGLLPVALLAGAFLSQLTINPAISEDCNANGIDDAQDLQMRSGNFPSSPRYRVGAPPVAISIGDFNQDGAIDLVTASHTPQGIFVLNNDGNGSFPQSKRLQTNKAPVYIVAADINGDGVPDLITADQFLEAANEQGTLSLFFNKGDETFGGPATKFVTGDPRFVLALDINNDSHMDLVAASRFAANITVLSNDGRGAFSKTDEHMFSDPVGSVTSGDFDGDDLIDIAVIKIATSFDTLVGNGKGTFIPRSGQGEARKGMASL